MTAKRVLNEREGAISAAERKTAAGVITRFLVRVVRAADAKGRGVACEPPDLARLKAHLHLADSSHLGCAATALQRYVECFPSPEAAALLVYALTKSEWDYRHEKASPINAGNASNLRPRKKPGKPLLKPAAARAFQAAYLRKHKNKADPSRGLYEAAKAHFGVTTPTFKKARDFEK